MSAKERLKKLRSVSAVEIGGDTFHVRALSLAELDEIDRAVKDCGEVTDAERKVSYARMLLAMSVCEANGDPVFDGHTDPAIDQVNTEALRALTDAAAEANGLSGGDEGNG